MYVSTSRTKRKKHKPKPILLDNFRKENTHTHKIQTRFQDTNEIPSNRCVNPNQFSKTNKNLAQMLHFLNLATNASFSRIQKKKKQQQ